MLNVHVIEVSLKRLPCLKRLRALLNMYSDLHHILGYHGTFIKQQSCFSIVAQAMTRRGRINGSVLH